MKKHMGYITRQKKGRARLLKMGVFAKWKKKDSAITGIHMNSIELSRRFALTLAEFSGDIMLFAPP